jgi:hypothetical protein
MKDSIGELTAAEDPIILARLPFVFVFILGMMIVVSFLSVMLRVVGGVRRAVVC